MMTPDKIRIQNLESTVETLAAQLDFVIRNMNALDRKLQPEPVIAGLTVTVSKDQGEGSARIITQLIDGVRTMQCESIGHDETGAVVWTPVELTKPLADLVDYRSAVSGILDNEVYYATFYTNEEAPVNDQ